MGSLEIPIDRQLKSHVIRSLFSIDSLLVCFHYSGREVFIYSIQLVGRMVMMTKMEKTRFAPVLPYSNKFTQYQFVYIIHFVRVVFKQNKNNLDWRVFTNSARIAFQLTLNWETPYFSFLFIHKDKSNFYIRLLPQKSVIPSPRTLKCR